MGREILREKEKKMTALKKGDKVPQVTWSRKKQTPEQRDENWRTRILACRPSFADEKECWIWDGCTANRGYASLGSEKMHRISYRLFVGSIPIGALICHHCDRPACVNPFHLFVGTQKENMCDAAHKGRLVKKLNHLKVRQIRVFLGAGIKIRAIAKEYGVHKALVTAIKRGRVWRNL